VVQLVSKANRKTLSGSRPEIAFATNLDKAVICTLFQTLPEKRPRQRDALALSTGQGLPRRMT